MPISFRRTLARLLASCALVLGVVACGNSTAGHSLRPSAGRTTVGTGVASHVGEVWNYGQSLTNIGGTSLRLDRVDVLGLPKGLTVIGVVAYRAEDTNGVVGLLKGDLAAEQPAQYGHPTPLKDAVIPAGSSDWYVDIEVTPNAPGDYITEGLRVWYIVNGKRQHQDFAARFKTTTK